MVGDYGEVLVVDWGLAKVLKQAVDPSLEPTSAVDEALVESLRSLVEEHP